MSRVTNLKCMFLTPMAALVATPAGAVAAVVNTVTGNRVEKIKLITSFLLQSPVTLLHIEVSSLYHVVAGKDWKFKNPESNGLFADKTTRRMANSIYSMNYVDAKKAENGSDEKVLRSFFDPKRLIVARVAALACLIFCVVPRAAEAAVVIPLGIISLSLHFVKLFTKNNKTDDENLPNKPKLIDKAINKVDNAFSKGLVA